MQIKSLLRSKLPLLICFLFFCAYAVLAIMRHNAFSSFGFDLGVSDQIVWKYSQFHAPITTAHFYPFTSMLTDHIELIYALLSPFYWIWNDVRMLLLLQTAFVCFSAYPLFLLAKKKKLHISIAYALLVSYLLFYGVQNALWFDVHSAAFAASFIPWFLYFLDRKHILGSSIFFALAILSKENVALITMLISAVFFIQRKGKLEVIFAALSVCYLLLVFMVYYPHFTEQGYRHQSNSGFLSIIQIENLVNTPTKQQVFLVSFAAFGMLPILAPLTLLPILGDLFSYFVIANNLPATHSIFMHYRIGLAPLLVWSTILAIARFPKLNRWYTAVYLLFCALLLQYMLHLPLSYLAKGWFWKEPASVQNIKEVLTMIPGDASVVSQNNITPHISHRNEIFTLFPEKKTFAKNAPCGQKECNWFRWGGNPQYLIVDTSTDWDIRHFLVDGNDFRDGLQNMEKLKYITKYKQKGDTVLYKIQKNP